MVMAHPRWPVTLRASPRIEAKIAGPRCDCYFEFVPSEGLTGGERKQANARVAALTPDKMRLETESLPRPNDGIWERKTPFVRETQ